MRNPDFKNLKGQRFYIRIWDLSTQANEFLWEIIRKDKPFADSIAKGNPLEADFMNMCYWALSSSQLFTQVDFPLGWGAFTEVSIHTPAAFT